MDGQQFQPQAGNATPVQQPQPAPKKKRGTKFLTVLLFIVLLGAAGAGLYLQNKQLSDKKRELTKANEEIASAKGQLEAEKVNLKLATNPGDSDFSPQCVSAGKASNSELIVAGINQIPVEGYQFYVVSCANDKSIPPKITAFKSENGTRTFAYGASTLEPMCFSKDVLKISAEKAAAINKATRIPLCKGV